MNTENRKCPYCDNAYSGYSALSRRDNKTLICPDCGTREALADLGIDIEDQEDILSQIHLLRDQKA